MPRGVPLADWNGQVLSETKKQLQDYGEQNIVPTVRAMFYTLVVLLILSNTQAAYRAFSHHTARWREKGIIPIDCFDDDIRDVI